METGPGWWRQGRLEQIDQIDQQVAGDYYVRLLNDLTEVNVINKSLCILGVEGEKQVGLPKSKCSLDSEVV